jgi:hypothetical protein
VEKLKALVFKNWFFLQHPKSFETGIVTQVQFYVGWYKKASFFGFSGFFLPGSSTRLMPREGKNYLFHP